MRRLTWLLLSIFIFSMSAFSGMSASADDLTIRFRNLDVQDGMPSNEVSEICQDNRGFIWFGTTNGIARFDGYEFKHFRANYQSLEFFSSNSILKIEESADNKLWLVTRGGINVFDPHDQSVKKISKPELKDGRIKTIKFIDSDRLLIGGADGLFVYHVGADSLWQYTQDEAGNKMDRTFVKSIFKDSKGNLWCGTWRQGIVVLNPTMSRIITPKHPLLGLGLAANCFKEDKCGNIYIGTWEDGLLCLESPLDSNKMIIKRMVHDKRNPYHTDYNIIYDIDIDDMNRVWVGSPSGLRIVSVTSTGFKTHDYNPIMDQNQPSELHEVRRIFRDRSGLTWLSDYGNGVMITQPHHSLITEVDIKKDNLNFGIVTSIYRASDNVLWLGIRGHSMVRYDMAKKEVIKAPDPFLSQIDVQSNAVMGFAEAPKTDQLFIATRYLGVYALDRKDGKTTSIKHIDTSNEQYRSMFTHAIIRDKQDNIWIGTNNGVVILGYNGAGRTYRKIDPSVINDSMRNCPIETLFADPDGSLWLGSSEAGLFRVKYDVGNDKLIRLDHYCVSVNNLNSNNVQTIYKDGKNRIWVGTYGGGLSRYDGDRNRFDIIKNMHLINSDVITSVREDSKGNLWLATGNGITCYNPNVDQGNIKNYGTGNGLKNTSFIMNAALKIGDKILFGGYDGLSIFDPDQLLLEREIVPPSIVDIQLFNTSISLLPKEKRRKIARFMPPYTEDIVLTYKDYSISIQFASPSYENSSLNKYAYRLEGLDKGWNYVTADKRIVTYTNLKPGYYTFSVIASNDQGYWSETPTDLHITVLPPPWQTATACLIYIVILFSAVYFSYRVIKNRIKLRRALEIEQIERLKSEEVNNAKLTFFTNVSHELFTPITIMSCSLEKLLESDSANSPLHLIIRSNLNRLMRLLQQIMEFRKVDSANIKLRVSQTDIVAFVRRMCDENFAPLVSDKNVKLIFTPQIDSAAGYVDTDKLDKIVYNLLSNAFKYNRQDGKIFVGLTMNEVDGKHYVEITVRDTGYGIAPEQIPLLFKRFYEGDYRKFNTTGTGIGLSLTKDLVTLHNGRITVESTQGEGTTFVVKLPTDKDAYSAEQIESEIIIDQAGQSSVAVLGPDTNSYTEVDRPTLLLVEDNDELLLVMQNVLQPRYNIVTARNGQQALDMLLQHEVDLVVTDFVMPVMDDAQLRCNIRANIETSHLPVIMLSAHSAIESKLKFFNAGVDAYVSKPFEIKLLVAQVNSILANRSRLIDAFKSDKNIATDPLINTSLDKQFIDSAVKLIEEHLSDSEFDINAFNKAMNMSNSTLYRKIKSITGLPPKEFIRNIKFKIACRLLLEKSSNISDVAFMVGFTDAKYFSLTFKKEFGISPREYINQNGKKITGARAENV